MKNSVFRIWQEGQAPDGVAPVEPTRSASATEMWMLLIVRMVTRVAISQPNEDGIDEEEKKEQSKDDALESDFFVRQDKLRQTLCDYIMSDFPARCEWRQC